MDASRQAELRGRQQRIQEFKDAQAQEQYVHSLISAPLSRGECDFKINQAREALAVSWQESERSHLTAEIAFYERILERLLTPSSNPAQQEPAQVPSQAQVKEQSHESDLCQTNSAVGSHEGSAQPVPVGQSEFAEFADIAQEPITADIISGVDTALLPTTAAGYASGAAAMVTGDIDNSPTTRERIDAFLAMINTTVPGINRTDLYTAWGYGDATEFQRFQRDHASTGKTARRNFEQMLTMDAVQFMAQLEQGRSKLEQKKKT